MTVATAAADEVVPMPFFVYGTLIPGHGNYSLVSAFVQKSNKARLQCAAIYQGPGYPYMLTRDLYPSIESDDTVSGMLLYMHSRDFLDALSVLDQLEGVSPTNDRSGLYQRIIVSVVVEGENELVQAYAYVAGMNALRRIHAGGLHRIRSGSWDEFLTEMRQLANDTTKTYRAN